MTLQNFLFLKQELLIVLLILILLVIDFSLNNKKAIIPITIISFFVIFITGLIPQQTGSLFGGMYKVTETTSLIKNILNIAVLIVFLQSATWLKKEENKSKITEYFILLLSSLVGMDFMISSGHFLMFYIGLEMATIPVAALAAYEKYKIESAEAGLKLIFSSALSSGILLYGISMLYGSVGTLYFESLSVLNLNNTLQILAFIMFFAGMAFKISLVPFHLWTADVYEGAPINVTSFLSVVSKGTAVTVLVILLYTVFSSLQGIWTELLYVISILTMTIANLFAIRQNNIKRFLAFSSIAQAGYILLGIIDGSILGMTAVIYFVLVYVFSNLGAFGVVSAIANATNKENINDYNGLYKTNPKLSLVLTLSLFSLAGIPPVAGFFGKFFLFTAAAHKGYYLLVLIAVLNATISLYYYLLVVKAMFININEKPIAPFKNDFYTRLALIICVFGVFVIGFLSTIYEYIYTIINS